MQLIYDKERISSYSNLIVIVFQVKSNFLLDQSCQRVSGTLHRIHLVRHKNWIQRLLEEGKRRTSIFTAHEKVCKGLNPQILYLVKVWNQNVSFIFIKISEWTFQVRFLCSINLLGSLFCMLAAIIFSTYFDGLVVLEKDKGYFITDNRSVNKYANEVLKVSLSGLSLTVISFTIVFLVRQFNKIRIPVIFSSVIW